jgi:hypothetical protein
MWKNAIVRWDWVDDWTYEHEEYDSIDEVKLNELLADDNIEVIGDLEYSESVDASDPTNPVTTIVYNNVKIKRKEKKSYVRIKCIPHENFFIDRNATSFDEFSYIGITEYDLTRSDMRKRYPDIFTPDFDDWASIGHENDNYNIDKATRQHATGQAVLTTRTENLSSLDANQTITVEECWVYADRDGDGISELKRIVFSGNMILEEEYADSVQLAALCPIEVPYEFYGLSMADITRPSTLTSTAILRGFVENTYLTNFSPRLADPNVVDFSALQNMKPKQIIPTNGNPQGAVVMMQPENISPGTVPLLQHMQTIKEQSNGLSKAAQGLNDTLYVSGNSEAKLSQVQSAAQKRIQHIARRYVKTGIERLVVGVYETIRKNAEGNVGYLDRGGLYQTVEAKKLPKRVNITVDANIGENSNENMQQKLGMVAGILGQLVENGRQIVIKETADARLASKGIKNLDLDPMDYIEDYNAPEFMERAQAARDEQTSLADRDMKVQELKAKYEVLGREANARMLATEADNKMQDNAKQLAVAIDNHHQEWAELAVKADKEGTPRPVKPPIEDIMKLAYDTVQNFGPSNQAMINQRLEDLAKETKAIDEAGDMGKMQSANQEPF